MEQRIIWIDWAKSFCMFLVILGHCHLNAQDGFISQFIYSFHMMFFFFLSGILCRRNLNFLSLKKDLQYIILPYFTYGLILIAFNTLRSKSLLWNNVSLQLMSLIIGDDCSIGPIWFLPALFICKYIFHFIKLTKSFNQCLYIVFIVISFIPAYFISKYNLNFPFFSDSALFGLPFFILGNKSYEYFGKVQRIKWYHRLWISLLLLCISYLLSQYNGFVSIASCTIGQSIYIYYFDSFVTIISISSICMILNEIQSTFVTITSYGTIATLGLHGIPLTIFNYYLPVLMRHEVSSYPLYHAIIYSSITYYLCYLCILFFDKRCAILFGLKGVLNSNNLIKKK